MLLKHIVLCLITPSVSDMVHCAYLKKKKERKTLLSTYALAFFPFCLISIQVSEAFIVMHRNLYLPYLNIVDAGFLCFILNVKKVQNNS